MPAAAVIRGVQALFGFIGRKARVGGFFKSDVKAPGSTWEVHWKLADLNTGEGSGIPSVGVKSVDIRRNTGGEGGCLDRY